MNIVYTFHVTGEVKCSHLVMNVFNHSHNKSNTTKICKVGS